MAPPIKFRIPSFSRKFRDDGPKTSPISSSYTYSNNNFAAEKDKTELIRDEHEDNASDVAIIFDHSQQLSPNGLSHPQFCTNSNNDSGSNVSTDKNGELPSVQNGVGPSFSESLPPSYGGDKQPKQTPKNLAVNNG